MRLEEVADFRSGGTPSKARADYWGGRIPWASAKDMKESRLRDTEDHITTAGLEHGAQIAPPAATLVLTRGMTLLTQVPICALEREVAFNQDVKAIIPGDELNPSYMTYALLAARPLLLSMVELAGHGTGRLPTDQLRALHIPLPPKAEQGEIAAILGTLDDKIELNRRMNETLEAMARAIFKSWFVDFDPVRAKAEGRRPFGINAETASLFPDSFEDSPLGRTPKGWKAGRLDDLLLLQRGFDLPASRRSAGPYPVLSASGVTGFHSEYRVSGPGVVTGRSGLIGKVFFVLGNFWPLNTTLWVKEFRIGRPIYVFHLLQGIDFEAYNAGSAVPTLNRNHVHGLRVIVPPSSVVQAYEEMARPFLCLCEKNRAQSETLAAVRDTLLPKLISGEIRVKAAQQLAEEHVR